MLIFFKKCLTIQSNTHERNLPPMTIKQLKEIIDNLSDETPVLLSGDDTKDVETVQIEFHSDGRCHVIFSSWE